MIWLKDKSTGLHYISNPGSGDDCSVSEDGSFWHLPANAKDFAERKVVVDRLLTQRSANLDRLANDLERKKFDGKLMSVVGAAALAVGLSFCALLTVTCITLIVNTVRAW